MLELHAAALLRLAVPRIAVLICWVWEAWLLAAGGQLAAAVGPLSQLQLVCLQVWHPRCKLAGLPYQGLLLHTRWWLTWPLLAAVAHLCLLHGLLYSARLWKQLVLPHHVLSKARLLRGLTVPRETFCKLLLDEVLLLAVEASAVAAQPNPWGQTPSGLAACACRK